MGGTFGSQNRCKIKVLVDQKNIHICKIYVPGPSKGCQMVPEGCQSTGLYGSNNPMKVVGSHGIYIHNFLHSLFWIRYEYLGGVVNCVLFWSSTFVESYDYPLAKICFDFWNHHFESHYMHEMHTYIIQYWSIPLNSKLFHQVMCGRFEHKIFRFIGL